MPARVALLCSRWQVLEDGRNDGDSREARTGSAMSIRIVRLGTPRAVDEGLRIGTVRRPPRGVRREHYASANWYDVWLPELAPQADTVRLALAATSAADWQRFVTRYRNEMRRPPAARVLDLLAAFSHQSNFSVGCYCADAARCHRSLLGELLVARGATLVAT